MQTKAITYIQPLSISLSKQLHHAFRPASAQLQWPLRSCPPLRASQVTPAPTGVTTVADDASTATSGNASTVRAAFIEAGLSRAAVDRVVTLYPSYLRWDVEQKLLPGLRRWQQELGVRFVSEIERIPYLLLKTPAEEQLKDQYLVSIGIRSPEILRKKCPTTFVQSLDAMQGRVAFLHSYGFSEVQVLSLVQQHPTILSRTPEHVDKTLKVIADIFGCAEDKSALSDVMLSCKQRRLFSMPPTTLHQNFSHFCSCVEANSKEMRRAWKCGPFIVAPAELDIKLESIVEQLDMTLDEAKSLVRRIPDITTLLPETVGLHVTELLFLGFSHGQVKSMCWRQPVLLTYSYSSDVRVAKWDFLTRVLRFNHDAIVAKPNLLMSSLPNRLGPRWEYLQQLRLLGVIAFTGAHEVNILNSLVFMTDSKFSAAYTTPQLRVYDQRFQKQWQRRWGFLLIDQQLSIQDIADNPALLHISLKDT